MLKYYRQNNNIITCFNIEANNLSDKDKTILIQLIEPNIDNIDRTDYIEYGTKTNTVTPWCSNCLNILQKCNIYSVNRIERTFLIKKSDFDIETIDPVTQTIYETEITEFKINDPSNNIYEMDINQSDIDPIDIDYYSKLFESLNRKPNNIEISDIIQTNNEHTRHFFFKGKLIKNKKEQKQSLFQMVKSTQVDNNNSLVCFHDNSSVFKGYPVNLLIPSVILKLKVPRELHAPLEVTNNSHFQPEKKLYNFTYTSETHNAPTGIAPFEGANTGIGGRIRDNQAVGRGGLISGSVTGYCVGEICPSKSNYWKKNLDTLILASNGVSDYANKFGEPSLVGYCRAFGLKTDQETIEYVKPILFSGGLGQIDNQHIKKEKPKEGMLIVKIGGPAYKIGFGGGAFSSREQNTKNTQDDLNAVQRGDPEMENKLNRFIRACVELGDGNPILSINDQGAGGNANAIKEMLYPNGGIIDLDKIKLGDNSMSALEIWISEYQENNAILINPDSLNLIDSISKRENIDYCVIGKVENTGRVQVYYQNKKIIDLPLEPILGDELPRREYTLVKINKELEPFTVDCDDIPNLLKQVLKMPSIGSKRFLVNKIDRSVTGLVAQQQCVGPLHTPLSNYGITAQSYYNKTGCAIAVGERPIIGLINPGKMARMSVGEMLTNIIFAHITDISDIKCSANWMWPVKFPGEQYNIYKACKEMCNIITAFGFSTDRGKDSLSMSYTDHITKETIKAPGSLVISGYAPMKDITKKITPDFKCDGSDIIYIDLSNGFQRMGASALFKLFDQIGNDAPDVNVELLRTTFYWIQMLMEGNNIDIYAGHDRSDGGLITTLCEMAFSGNLGFEINIDSDTPIEYLFNEELGLVLEVNNVDTPYILDLWKGHAYCLGKVTENKKIIIKNKNNIILNEDMTLLRDCWELPSYEFEKLQCNIECADQEYLNLKNRKTIEYKINPNIKVQQLDKNKYKMAVIREEGSNGDRELANAFYSAGFEVYDMCMNDFINDETLTLDSFRGIAFCGGFSYSDVFASAKGWYAVIKSNERINNIFEQFRNRDDTFVLGICNGCQLLSLLEWIPKCKLEHNRSNKFESRFPTIKINKTNSIFFDNMEDSILGCWIAHGEGRFVLDKFDQETVPLQYVDDDFQVTELYPFNPSGSTHGVAAISSKDGRCLAMMPHPERCFLNWQIPYDNIDMQLDDQYSVWYKMFENAYAWCG